MSNTLLIADQDESSRKLFKETLSADGYQVIDVADGAAAFDVIKSRHVDVLITNDILPGISGTELLERARKLRPKVRAIVVTSHGSPDAVIAALDNQACDFLAKPVDLEELREAVRAAFKRRDSCEVEIISAKPDWIEIRVPCDLTVVEPIQNLLTGIEGDLPKETREEIGAAFREMLNNAIEHGGKGDLSRQVTVKYIRLRRAVLYSIVDPGEGFDMDKIEHAAVSNPAHDPLRHMEVREQKGIRPGGFGIMLTEQAIDELIFNERHNELIFIKYVDETPAGTRE
ncbi:MAG TPA: response regulator [Blastocatellia bacterium]|jgi:DNA-binding response OmpR family regulator|nr:response regulator [Blastocatellia bacterium]